MTRVVWLVATRTAPSYVFASVPTRHVSCNLEDRWDCYGSADCDFLRTVAATLNSSSFIDTQRIKESHMLTDHVIGQMDAVRLDETCVGGMCVLQWYLVRAKVFQHVEDSIEP